MDDNASREVQEVRTAVEPEMLLWGLMSTFRVKANDTRALRGLINGECVPDEDLPREQHSSTNRGKQSQGYGGDSALQVVSRTAWRDATSFHKEA